MKKKILLSALCFIFSLITTACNIDILNSNSDMSDSSSASNNSNSDEVNDYTEGLIIKLIDGWNTVVDYKGKDNNVIIPDKVQAIGDHAFSRYRTLESISIPNSVFSIGDYAFSGCEFLTSINISSAMVIGEAA